MSRAVIFGCEGAALTPDEAAFFRQADPFGFILFARNVEAPDQLRALTASLRETVGWNAPILIDQEGGRVQRMGPPNWRQYLPALDQMRQARDPMRAQYIRNRLIAAELHDVGIDVDCAPLADLVEPQTHPVLLNRLYGEDVDTVVEAARVCAEALLDGGVLPVLKHIPGYGRASVDSHAELPRLSEPVEELVIRDFAPFRALKDMGMGMTAHIVVNDIDPDQPATTSERMIRLIREEIGFSGLLMTDDIGMEALSGTMAQRAAGCLDAGCDLVLHCNGTLAEREQVASACTLMTGAANARADAALSQRKAPLPIDTKAMVAELADLLN
ncbi:glycoside hydrolase family 3 N-terminal domain-containing protein [Pelagovum pacificum]|uniref:beta-N-acetylhexosaminidase n=1 Tax=Pelagovum pacificum TaxID=2588711 RepID=A0A5C5GDS4_9RHOB|nr:glycoside hydrolase family 3 N-terminal domain-containing protein [Pelagovum pacificum]QQA44563.1 glycoside hydrolase family 3 protein [Pelagovum pacificum]TNY32324.1 glycoside hydrolase family 3 protein [Pelagovum pacificum]